MVPRKQMLLRQKTCLKTNSAATYCILASHQQKLSEASSWYCWQSFNGDLGQINLCIMPYDKLFWAFIKILKMMHNEVMNICRHGYCKMQWGDNWSSGRKLDCQSMDSRFDLSHQPWYTTGLMIESCFVQWAFSRFLGRTFALSCDVCTLLYNRCHNYSKA